MLQGALAARGLRRVVGLTTPHFPAALAVVSQSDMAAPLPRRLAAAFADGYRLKLFDLPIRRRPSTSWRCGTATMARTARSPGCADVLREVAAEPVTRSTDKRPADSAASPEVGMWFAVKT